MPSPSRLFEKYGPWAVVTGASSGIGQAFSVRLASEGFSLVVTARREDRLNDLAAKLSSAHNIQTKVVPADLATATGWQATAEATRDVDVGLLINNAGVEVHGSFFRDSVETHLKLIAVNVSSVTSLAHVFGRRFADQGRGGIIFVSSVSSRPAPWWATYGASKSYVSALSVILREELKPKGVDVLALEPGPTMTPMAESVSQDVDFSKMGVTPMPVEEVVDEALEKLEDGTAKWVPGFALRMQTYVFGMLPMWLQMKIGGYVTRSSMNNALFEYS